MLFERFEAFSGFWKDLVENFRLWSWGFGGEIDSSKKIDWIKL